jgi:hypothetical protein
MWQGLMVLLQWTLMDMTMTKKTRKGEQLPASGGGGGAGLKGGWLWWSAAAATPTVHSSAHLCCFALLPSCMVCYLLRSDQEEAFAAAPEDSTVPTTHS